MDIWNYLEYGAWALSAAFGLYIVPDWIKTDRSYSEEMLTSSRAVSYTHLDVYKRQSRHSNSRSNHAP